MSKEVKEAIRSMFFTFDDCGGYYTNTINLAHVVWVRRHGGMCEVKMDDGTEFKIVDGEQHDEFINFLGGFQ